MNSSRTEHVYIQEDTSKDISSDVRDMVQLICHVIISPVLAVFGIGSNIINMCVFYRQGLSESVNISYFTLAANDLLALIFCLWFGVGVNPLITSSVDLNFNLLDVVQVTGALPRLLFAKLTCWITVYITVERCFCVIAPLHVKTLITPRRTILVFIIFFTVGVLTSYSMFYLGDASLAWNFDAQRNRTMFGLKRVDDPDKHALIYSLINLILFFTTFICMIISTIFLSMALHTKSRRRQNEIIGDKRISHNLSKRDAALSKTIVLLSGALILNYLPYTLNCILMSAIDGFVLLGRFNNLFVVMWSISWLFENHNSAITIFIYYNMSTKYKEMFRKMFSCLWITAEASENRTALTTFT